MPSVDTYAQGMEVWPPLDKLLCELVARLGKAGYHHTLEVELRPTEVGSRSPRQWEIDLTRVLPEFREKGVVTIPEEFSRKSRPWYANYIEEK